MSDLERVKERLQDNWPEIDQNQTPEDRQDAFLEFVTLMRDEEGINALRVVKQHPKEFPMIEFENDWSESMLRTFDSGDSR